MEQFQAIIADCRSLFEKKHQDYGTSWQIMRVSSLTDQILIKAQRIRNLQEGIESKIPENQTIEFIGIVNYSILAMIQLEKKSIDTEDLVFKSYDGVVDEAIDLMLQKNNDYGEIWRSMRISSMTDLILMKLMRIRQIENHGVQFSEGLKANFQDILNYAVFCLILQKFEV